jgi:uncharacterized protein YkwD
MEGRVVRRFSAVLVAAAAVAAVLVPAGTAATQQPAVALSALESGVIDGINAFRAQHGLGSLSLSAELTAAARAHTTEMAADGYFEHESANGQAFWKRIAAFYPQGNRPFWSVGENLLYASPDIDAAATVQAWIESPEHRANMLNPHWRDIGIGAIHAVAAPGTYDGEDVTIVTVDFGVRTENRSTPPPVRPDNANVSLRTLLDDRDSAGARPRRLRRQGRWLLSHYLRQSA